MFLASENQSFDIRSIFSWTSKSKRVVTGRGRFMEVIGGVSAIAGIADQLLKACLTAYDLFTAAQNAGKDFESYLYRLEVSKQNFRDWFSKVESDGRKLHDIIDPNSVRYQLLLQTLAKIAGTFAEVEQLKTEYSICNVDDVADAKSSLVKLSISESYSTSASSESPKSGGILRGIRSKFTVAKFRSRGKTVPPARGSQDKLERTDTGLSSADTLVEYTSTRDDLGPVVLVETDHDLDAIVSSLDKWALEMQNRAARYQQVIPTLARYKWAYTGGQQTFRLVEDLETYIGYLQSLTKYPLERLEAGQLNALPTPFDEFKVQWQLPYPRLGNFCGREDVFQEMQSFLTGSIDEKGRLKKSIVTLQGMGGLGKSQIALEYLYRNQEVYASVFWVDSTDESTVCDSGRQILNMLIAHYSAKYRGSHNFSDVATDLGIPGKVKNDGMLVDDIAKAPWPAIKRWLAREGNSGWCLVVDGLNVPEDEERMRELLPACNHGHIIVTSRVSIGDTKLIEIPEMDESSSLRLLLHDKLDTASKETREAAKSIAKELGYLPLALSQASAYVIKRALGFVEYLKRLTNNMAIYICEKIPRYP
ncbi:hypothetical protein TWF730_009848 [Orbilia blumenaviensis]|uniref:NB-ARC domain-containing protein n=1 Tax=Orbilia blumenaviensis TaxID=1796055 RepID=A0AAV9UTU0_9PEZI